MKRIKISIEEQKKLKMLAVNQATVTAVVKSTLKGTGIGYRLDLGENRAYLTLRLDNGLETKFMLSYKSFMKKIPYIRTTVEQLNGIMRTLEQPLRIKSTYYRQKDDWEISE